MSVEGEVDLDALIQKDKKQAKNNRTHIIKKRRQQQRQQRQQKLEKKFRKFDESNQRHDRYNPHQNKNKEFKQYKQKPHKRQERPVFKNQVFALSVHGFVSDVSIDDILNLTQNRKVISVKTQLKRKDQEPIDPKQDTEIQVVIIFAEKSDADSFMKEYSEKILDGKHSLSFSFISPSLD